MCFSELQVSIHVAYFSGLQNDATTFACLAEELGKANSAMQDLQTFLKPLGGRCTVTCATLVSCSPYCQLICMGSLGWWCFLLSLQWQMSVPLHQYRILTLSVTQILFLAHAPQCGGVGSNMRGKTTLCLWSLTPAQPRSWLPKLWESERWNHTPGRLSSIACEIGRRSWGLPWLYRQPQELG